MAATYPTASRARRVYPTNGLRKKVHRLSRSLAAMEEQVRVTQGCSDT
jgi:hypothetical protein